MSKVAIIGAGLAAVCAARRLRAAGHQVSLFEKSRGLGGRMSTKREDWSHLDLGAQYFTADSNDFREEIARWCKQGVAARWYFQPYKKFPGAPLQASPDDRERFVGTPDMNSIVKALTCDLDIHINSQVENLQRLSNAWELSCHNDLRLSGFDWVLVTLPAEQAVPLVADVCELNEAVPAKVHLPCWALGISTRGAVAPDIQGIFGDDIVLWAARQSSKPFRAPPQGADDAWVLHFSPKWTEEHGKETKTDIVDIGMNWLRGAFEQEIKLHKHILHFWRYANISPQRFNKPYFVDETHQLALVGSWCAGGKVEGAFKSAEAFIRDFFAL